MLNAMRRLSKKPYEMIRRKVADGKVAGADETGVNVNGINNWLWTFRVRSRRTASITTINFSL